MTNATLAEPRLRSVTAPRVDRAVATVTSHAYAVVRHPICSGLFVSLAAFVLRAWSPTNLLIAAIGAGLFVVKTFMEEDFLCEDAAYRRYMTAVRWRWFPGIA